MKAAVSFLKANAAKYGFNPDKVALMGVSARGFNCRRGSDLGAFQGL